MHRMHEIAGLIAGGLFLAAFIPYVILILDGRVRPNRATWIIWTILGFLILASYRSVGADAIWVAVAGAIGPLVILALSVRYGEGGTAPLDLACLAGTGMGIVAWYLTSNPFVGLVIFLASDWFGSIPTIVKTWREPESESLVAWGLWWLGSVFQFLALSDWELRFSLYPLDFIVAQTIVILFALRRFRPRTA